MTFSKIYHAHIYFIIDIIVFVCTEPLLNKPIQSDISERNQFSNVAFNPYIKKLLSKSRKCVSNISFVEKEHSSILIFPVKSKYPMMKTKFLRCVRLNSQRAGLTELSGKNYFIPSTVTLF